MSSEGQRVSLDGMEQPQSTRVAVPTEVVPLPSRGACYPKGSPLHGAEYVEIRSMTARDEDILTSRALLKQGKVVSSLLASCMVDKSIDVDQMLTGDRNAIMVAIRVTGYGADYRATVSCPACEEKSDFSFNLSKLPIKPLGASPDQPGVNCFSWQTSRGRNVRFKLLTGADDREMVQQQERRKKALGPASVENAVTTRLLFSLISIDGEEDRTKLARLVDTLPALESKEIRQRIDDINPGVDMVQAFSCQHCGEESEVDVPLGPEFFWPSRRR